MQTITNAWQTSANGRFLLINGDKNACVYSHTSTTQGYLWVFHQSFGYSPDLATACAMVEALDEAVDAGLSRMMEA